MDGPIHSWMLYGANGYTGELIAREAVSRGWNPVLAGRNRDRVEQLGSELSCKTRIFSIDESDAIAKHLHGVSAVLNCAGPFSKTAPAVMDACIQKQVHYLDITGEIEVIEAAAARNSRAINAGITLLPAVGFDVVPSDCLAAALANRLPDANHLELAIGGLTRVSRGTAKTILEGIPSGGRVRIDGVIQRVPTAWKAKEIPFREGKSWAMTIPWGDVGSAFHSTGIPNIEVFASTPLRQIRWIRRLRLALPLLQLSPVKSLASRLIDKRVVPPSRMERESGKASLWGRVSSADGQRSEATLVTPDGYGLTVLTALLCVQRLLSEQRRQGFFTPSRAFGPGLITKIAGCDLQFTA